MDLVKPMLRAIFLLALVSLSGCSSKKEAGMAERYLYFTGTFPADFKWEVLTHFKATSGGRSCSTLTWARGKPEPTILTESQMLEKSGDTVKVRLFYAKKPECGWKLNEIAFQDKSQRCVVIHSLYLKDEVLEAPSSNDKIPAPETLEMDCKPTPDSPCLRCEESDGNVNTGYKIPLQPVNRFAIKLNFPGGY
jgi:hypothetical protein